ncbi:MAG: hypothetical protein JZD41_00385 [Thermoproteus sp.]|nr:hypothetical protein [Thermoproteus sp.]
MRWLIELLFAVILVALAVYALTFMPKSPIAVTAGRQDVEAAYNTLLQLSLDPAFLQLLQNAICGGDPSSVRAALNSTLPPTYVYNFTVYLAGSSPPPPCLVCAPWGQKLLSVARPAGWSPGGVGQAASSSATAMAVLPDGTQVELMLYLGRA